MSGKVTVVLASYWACVTDSVVYPPTGSTVTDREMSTPPTPQWGMAPLPSVNLLLLQLMMMMMMIRLLMTLLLFAWSLRYHEC